MTGLYIHIPFCESICPYCDFSTWKAQVRHHSRWFEVIKKEMESRIEEGLHFSTLYFGGGTPSELDSQVLENLFSFLKTFVDPAALSEITFEANPNSLNLEKLEILKSFGVHRISIGNQSFDDEILKSLGRIHSSLQSQESIESALNHGFDVSLDLMFGVPLQTKALLRKDLETTVQFEISHLSLYGLTIEPNTLFHQKKTKGTLPPIADHDYDSMYLEAFEFLEKNGLSRYEVSNFSKPGKESLHNSNYWNHTPYLGMGPGAHSFFGEVRYGNSKKFAEYERWVRAGCPSPHFHQERLSDEQKYSESIWLGLRTKDGVNLKILEDKYKIKPESKKIEHWSNLNMLETKDSSKIRLIEKGWLFVDEISADLVL